MLLLLLLLPVAFGGLLISQALPDGLFDALNSSEDDPLSLADLASEFDLGDATTALDEVLEEIGDDAIIGTIGPDTLTGTPGADFINGLSGHDQIDGLQQSDTILGSSGNDTILGNGGSDFISAGTGDDSVDGGSQRDLIDGGPGDDTIHGGGSNDVIGGDSGDDLILGGSFTDILFGNAGDDTVDGQHGNDFIVGGLGADSILGGTGRDILYGGAFDLTGVDVEDDADVSAILAALRGLSDANPDIFEDATVTEIFSDPAFSDLGVNIISPTVGDTVADTLIGGGANDVLLLEDGDTGFGGSGADTFALPSEAPATAITIEDYEVVRDLIVVHYGDAQGTAPSGDTPSVSVTHGDGVASIVVDGAIVANVVDPAATLDADAIQLVDRADLSDLISARAS